MGNKGGNIAMLQMNRGKMELTKEKQICIEDKHEGHLFEIVLSEVTEKGYLKEADMERIQIEMIQLWKQQIEAFNNGRSYSITEANAKRLLESMYFTLGFRFQALEDLDDSITLLKEKSVGELFEEGQSLIKQQFERLKERYEELKLSLIETDNIAYNDTYKQGLEPFFKNYKLEFESQECPSNIDYPLSNDKMEKVGIDYMADYIEKSLLEHSLCLKFKEEIEAILEGFHKGYRDLLVNIFELVLMNAIGRLILKKDLSSLYLQVSEIEEIEKVLEILPTPLLNNRLMDIGMEVLNQLDLTSDKMKRYTAQTIRKYVPRIELALEDEMLETIFIAQKQEKEANIRYIAGKRLEDEAFKQLTERIRECDKVEDKINWMREKVGHIDDLRDVLEADCIFDEEYQKVYQSLEDMELALLLNSVRIDKNDVTEIEVDREWFKYLKKYLEQMTVERQNAIKDIAYRTVQF